MDEKNPQGSSNISKVCSKFFEQGLIENAAPKRQLKLPYSFSFFEQGLVDRLADFVQGLRGCLKILSRVCQKYVRQGPVN